MATEYILKETQGYSFKWVWENVNEDEKNDVKVMWRQERAMPEELMDARLEELVYIVRLQTTNEVIGVSTVFEKFNEQLESYFYYMRSFIVRSHRKNSVSANMVLNVIEGFDSRHQDGDHVIGLFIEITNEAIKRGDSPAGHAGSWPLSDLVYIGKNEQGRHCRVRYFNNATLFTPRPSAH